MAVFQTKDYQIRPTGSPLNPDSRAGKKGFDVYDKINTAKPIGHYATAKEAIQSTGQPEKPWGVMHPKF